LAEDELVRKVYLGKNFVLRRAITPETTAEWKPWFLA
jgi:hypothetical protein